MYFAVGDSELRIVPPPRGRGGGVILPSEPSSPHQVRVDYGGAAPRQSLRHAPAAFAALHPPHSLCSPRRSSGGHEYRLVLVLSGGLPGGAHRLTAPRVACLRVTETSLCVGRPPLPGCGGASRAGACAGAYTVNGAAYAAATPSSVYTPARAPLCSVLSWLGCIRCHLSYITHVDVCQPLFCGAHTVYLPSCP